MYPFVEQQKCVQCGICDKVCPIRNPISEKGKQQRAYLVQHKDEVIRMDSSAGGAFTAIATNILNKSGIVFGAAYDDKFRVHHICINDIADLKRLRNSKYVQSDLEDCFKKVKDYLNADKWVCFSGTPCQIEGLSGFLRKQYEKLLLVDVVCHGVPSPLIWNRYLEYQNVNLEKTDNIRFRDKYYGYKYSTMSVIRNRKKVYHAGSQLDPMLRAFFSDICDRPSCYDCRFKKRYRISDITIWDCFSVYDFDKKMDDDKGTTRVLCHTEKGNLIIQEIGDMVKCKEVSAEKIVKGVKEMFSSIEMNEKRRQFFDEAQQLDGKALFNKYYPITIRVKIKTEIRKILLISGMYSISKRILNKMRGR